MSLLCFVLLAAAVFTTPVVGQALDVADGQPALKPRVVGPRIEWTVGDTENFDPSWIHVKFAEGSAVELIQPELTGAVRSFIGKDGELLHSVNHILTDAAEITRTFAGDRQHYQNLKAKGEAASGAIGPDLSLWFNVRITDDRQGLVDKVNALNELDVVEIAHPAPVCATAKIFDIQLFDPFVNTIAGYLPGGGTPDFTPLQDYLYDTPVGLDAPSAWSKGGGRGAGIKFIDVELGWTYNHEDFSQDLLFNVHANDDPVYRDHGTAVVGEVCAMDNGFGVVGFASAVQWGAVGITVGEWPVVPHYFMEAAELLDPGDVWLIELQMFPAGFDATPMEYLQVNFDAIWTSSFALDVICVEAGANGSQNLDSAAFNGLFDRDIRDSGAIMVGAGTPVGRVAEWFTNWGSRMDAHAWGSQIVTTGYGDLQGGPPTVEYTGAFGGTSGASPMVVGSALCLQGIKKLYTGTPYTPLEMRTLINSTGINHADPSKEIGPRPDIGAAVADVLGNVVFGDTNGDGSVNLLDVAPFVDAVGGGPFIPQADVNCDGVVNLLDVDPFIVLLGS